MTEQPIPSLSWRDDDDDKVLPTPRQGGIPAKKFHANSNNRRPRQQRFLNKVLQDSADTVIRQQRKQVNTIIKLKRAAYKEVTSLKTWPLQDLALKDLDHWTMVHLDGSSNSQIELDDTNTVAAADGDVETHGDSTGLSSSSLEEPKRLRRKDSDDEEDLSPRKSTQRHQFKHDFIRERNLPVVGAPDEESLLPALWCMEPRIFSVEKSATGKRKYMVGHLGRFLDYYWRKVDPNQRHYYELIREKTPCRLYLDLEFSKKANPDISEEDSDHLMEEFLQELIVEFQTVYDLQIGKENMMDLDSSTDTKFSRHVVVHLPGGALFADTVAVGRFVRVFVGRLADEVATGTMMNAKHKPALAKHLFVNSAPSKRNTTTLSPSENIASRACFVDLGVYTRNRLFRIMGSSKFGKPPSAALRIAPTNQFPLDIGNESFYAPAIDKQAAGIAFSGEKKDAPNDKKDGKKQELDDDMKSFKSSVDWTAHAEALAATLVVPMNVSKRNFPILLDSEAAKAFDDATTTTGKQQSVSSASLALNIATKRSTVPSTAVKTGRSLFPFMDKYVLDELATRGGVQGSIRGWSIDYQEGNSKLCTSITYQMSRNRWCEAIGRPHKSNNIMWTIDFTTMEATQGCHDPECRSMRFRGQATPLPHDVQEELRDALFEHELAQLADEAESMNRKKSPTSQCKFDDAEFERALLALKINGDDTPKKSNIEKITQDSSTTGERVSSQDEFEALDDDVLWNAAVTNPELFP